MADYIESTYAEEPQSAESLIGQGRDYIIDSTITTVTYLDHLVQTMEAVFQGQELAIESITNSTDSICHRAAACKRMRSLKHLEASRMATKP